MSIKARLSFWSMMFVVAFLLGACQTTQTNTAKWWEVPGTNPEGGQQAQSPNFDPVAVPRNGTEIPLWDPSQPTLQLPNAEEKAQEWLTKHDVRKGVSAARVGLLVPLSGRAEKIGNEILNAAQLALFDFAGPNYELLPYDTKSTEAGAMQAASYAIADGVSIIIGPLLSGSTRAIAPLLQAANVNALAFTNDGTAAGDHVFVLGVRPQEEVKRIINYAAQQGSQRFALLAPADEYGIRVRAAFERTLRESGLQQSKVVQYLGSDDLAALIRQMADYDQRRAELIRQKNALKGKSDSLSRRALERLDVLQTIGDVDFDALLVAAGGESLQEIAANLPYYDIDPKKVRMLGTSLWNAPWVGSEPALLGGWFASTSPNNRTDFVKQYQDVYGKPPHVLATLAYDAIAISAVLSNDDGNADYSFETLTDSAGFLGRNGIFRLLNDGTTEHGLSVLQVLPKSFREISPAPKTFDPVIN